MERVIEWSKNSKVLTVKFFSEKAWELAFVNDITGDAVLMGLAIILVTTYSFFVLGACSPVHFRGVSTFMGLLCILLSCSTGYSVSFAAGL